MAGPLSVPLNALRATEIVARRGALAPAADELGVTIGAVSQHLRRAEERLGVSLFARTPHGLVPTAALQAALPRLSAGFSALGEAVDTLAPVENNVLTLTVASVFASRWLVWRLGQFAAIHPEIELRLVVTGSVIDLHRPDIDCAIRYGKGAWPGARSERLGGSRYRPVAAPALAKTLRTPADLGRVPVIEDRATMLSWAAWFAAAGAVMPVLSGPSFDDPALAFDAAASGQGVLLAVDLMSVDALRHGRLVRPFATVVDNWLGYWFVTPENRHRPSKVLAFRDWLGAEMEKCEEG